MDIDLNGGDCSEGEQQPQQQPNSGGAGDLSADLLQKFSCMNTTDRDVLIEQLKRLLGDSLNDDSAHFWLDMNNWNLQAAICSYFDYEQPSHRLPSMKLVSDVTIGEGEEVPPNCKFTKTWRIANTGDDSWPTGCCLRFTDGDQMCHSERVLVDSLLPGDTCDISVDMISPQKPGIYQGQWRMSTSTGQFFGDIIWVIITVSEGGLLSVTQQMSRFNELGSASPLTSTSPSINANPFANNSINSINRSHFDHNNSNQLPLNEQQLQQNTDESMPNSDSNIDDSWG